MLLSPTQGRAFRGDLTQPDVPTFFAHLPQHLTDSGIVPLDGVYQFELAHHGRWTLTHGRDGTRVEHGFTSPKRGHLALTAEILQAVCSGELDPVRLMHSAALDYRPGSDEPLGSVPAEHGEAVRLLTLLLQCFNARHLDPRFRDHVLGRFYRTGTCDDASGERVIVGGWSIPASVGQLLHRLVVSEGLSRTLEIGLAYGMSALYICVAHRTRGSGLHSAIDPWQTSTFRDIGRLNVERSGLTPWFELLAAPDWQALPMLLERRVLLDLAFIDGLHLFDSTLLDFFYSDLMLRPGGYVVFDDCAFAGVERVISYVLSNRAYELVERHHDRVAVLRKTAVDDRAEVDVSFHQPF